ncbi:MAG: hypothetical protein ABI217_00870 [Chthoniobacterales bacterium]
MSEFLQRLKERKLLQCAVAYVAAAFAFLGWPEDARRGPQILL